MRLLITTPTAVVIDDQNVTAVRAEDESGSFGILTGHADLLTALNVSIVSWHGANDNARYCAVRRGVLSVTNGNEVAIATREAVPGDDLEHLEQVVLAEFQQAPRHRAHLPHGNPAIADEGDSANCPLPASRPAGRDGGRIMNVEPNPMGQQSPDGLAAAARQQRERRDNWKKEGEPSMMRFVGQIGVLGWIIVTPTLIGLFVGRWLDHKLGTGIFWSAPLLLIGVMIGFWSAWRWMHQQ